MYEVVNNSMIAMGLTNDEIVYLRGINFITGMKIEDAIEVLYNNITTRKDMFYDVIITPVTANEGRSKIMLQRPKKK
jgi:methenyltetrahydromethanopterin cyclohydrolase